MQALADALGRYSTATLFEAAGKCGAMSPALRPMVPGIRMAGLASTLRIWPGDTLRIWPGDTLGVLRLIDAAPSGSVLVIDAGGTGQSAVWGGTSVLACLNRDVRGCVTNGCVRDMDDITRLGFPLFAAGVSPRGTTKHHPGWPGVPVSVGDCVVCEGDIVIGDSDGVIVIAAAEAADILPRAAAQAEREEARDRAVQSGRSLADVLGLPT
jgi:4-hydroxy-4-methyl-2-oxoglutarate aldolase